MKIDTNKKQYILCCAAFILGCLFSYVLITITKASGTNTVDNYAIRKTLTGKLISPLLLGGDNQVLYDNGVLFKSIKGYINTSTNNGDTTNISVYFKNLTSGAWFGVNENDHYAPASLMKVPIMIAVFKEAESNHKLLEQEIYYDGKNDLNTEEYYKPQDKILPGHSYSVESLIGYMINYSDNNATRLLLSVTPQNNLTEIFTDLGLPIPNDNTTGTVDYMSDKLYSRLFRVLYNSTYLNEEYSEKALRILVNPDFPNGIIAPLPKSVSVANKFGERTVYDNKGVALYRELHDCGIIYKDSSPYLLCIMTKGSDFKSLESIIQAISKLAYSKTN